MAAPLNGLGNELKTLRSVAIHRRLMVWKPIAENPSRNRSFSPIRVTRDAKVSIKSVTAHLPMNGLIRYREGSFMC
jgi:hypothetical protein